MSKWIITVKDKDDSALGEMERSPEELFIRVAFGNEVIISDIQMMEDSATETDEERADYAAHAFTLPHERRPVAVARARAKVPDADETEERCPVCRRVHTPPEVIVADKVRLWPGHEYVIRTRWGNQKYPRESRMGYMGFGYGLEFSARGPDGTHDGQYGGTQHFDLQHVIYAREVERDDSERYVGRIFRG